MREFLGAVALGTALVMLMASSAFAAKTPQPTADQLKAHLVALDAMPTGWSLDTSPPPAASQTQGFCNGPNVQAMVEAIPGNQNSAVAFIENPTAGPRVSEFLASYPTVKAAKQFMATLSKAAKTCTAWDGTSSSGSAYHYTLAPENVPKAADQTIGLRISAASPDSSGLAGNGDAIFHRSGPVIISVNQAGLSLDPAITARTMAKALKAADPIL
jgi:hypothetical protein